MFLGYQNGKIVLVKETREELENAPCMSFDEIKETQENYFLYNGEYVTEIPTPTIAEQVDKLEAETGLTRVMREMVLAENSGASDYVKAKAQEIEDLAKALRTTEEPSGTEVVVSETENTTTISDVEKVDETETKEYNSFSDTEK